MKCDEGWSTIYSINVMKYGCLWEKLCIANELFRTISCTYDYPTSTTWSWLPHDDVIKWKHFPRNWPFVRKIHRSPVNFPHKGQWRGALMFSLIYVWINDWANNREAGDLRRQHGHYDVIVMPTSMKTWKLGCGWSIVCRRCSHYISHSRFNPCGPFY